MTCASITTADYQELLAFTGSRFSKRLRALSLPAHEIVHEVYLRAARKDVVWSSRAHFRNWSRLAASHALIDLYRKSSGFVVENVDPEFLPSSHSSPVASQLDVWVGLDELASVSPRQFDAIRLRYVYGFSIHETADQLKVSERTVKRDAAAGLLWLRARLEGHDVIS